LIVEIFHEGDDPQVTREVAWQVASALAKPVYQCRLCDFTTRPDSVGAMLEELGEHGTEAHPDVFTERH
jgi:hypothetical protein